MNFGLRENDNGNMDLSMLNIFNNLMNRNMNNPMINNMNNPMMNNMNNPMMNNMNNPMMNNMNNNMMNMNNLMNPFMNFNPFFMMSNIHFSEYDSLQSKNIVRKEGLDIKCDVDRLLKSNHELENKNRDLQTIINYIPFTIIQDEPKNLKNEIRCVICLSDFEIGEKVSALPCCHTFHTKCLDEWINRKQRCPVCKFEITLKSILGEDLIREHLKIIKEKEELKRKKEKEEELKRKKEEELKREKKEEEIKRKKEEILKWRKEKEKLKRKKEEEEELKWKKEKEKELKKKKEIEERLKRKKE